MKRIIRWWGRTFSATEATYWRNEFLRVAVKYERLEAALRSLSGSGPPGAANCDTLWQRRFADLDKEYRLALRERDRAANENTKLKILTSALIDQLQEYGTAPARMQ